MPGKPLKSAVVKRASLPTRAVLPPVADPRPHQSVKQPASSQPESAPILDAAEAVAIRDGVGRVTLEAVAREAGLSKSGLIHHYPSKDALLTALVRRKVEMWWAHCKAAMDAEGAGVGAATRGLIKACYECPDAQQMDADEQRRGCVVLAALIHDPAHIEPVRATFALIDKRLERDGLPPGVADVVRLSLDGMWFNLVLGLGGIDDGRRERVRSVLEGLTEAGRREDRNVVAAGGGVKKGGSS